jgi:hypothetical protein
MIARGATIAAVEIQELLTTKDTKEHGGRQNVLSANKYFTALAPEIHFQI